MLPTLLPLPLPEPMSLPTLCLHETPFGCLQQLRVPPTPKTLKPILCEPLHCHDTVDCLPNALKALFPAI